MLAQTPASVVVTHAAASTAASGSVELSSPVDESSPAESSSPELPPLDPELPPLDEPDVLPLPELELPLVEPDPEVLPLVEPDPEVLPPLEPEPLPLLDVEFPPLDPLSLHPTPVAATASALDATRPTAKLQRERNFMSTSQAFLL